MPAKISDGMDKEHRPVSVLVQELLAHVIQRINKFGGVHIAKTDILNADRKQSPPHFVLKLRTGDVHLICGAQGIVFKPLRIDFCNMEMISSPGIPLRVVTFAHGSYDMN